MRYVYYVSFLCFTEEGNGFGSNETIAHSPITTMEDVKSLENLVKERNPNVKAVTIMNFILLRTEDE